MSSKEWSPETLSDNSVGFPVGLEFKFVQISGKNLKTDAMIIKGGPSDKKNLFIALFDKEDVDFEIRIKNHSQWNVMFTITINDERHSFIIEKHVETSMKALKSNGKHLHFLSQKTEDGKLLVAMSAKLNGTTYEEASINCSRIDFDFGLEKSEEEIEEEKEKKRILFESRLRQTNGPVVEVYIKRLTGETIQLEMFPQDSIEFMKGMIEFKDGIPLYQQRLIYRGVQLSDGWTLQQHNIENGSTIHCVLNLRGGGYDIERGVVCFGKKTDQRFGDYNKRFIASQKFKLQGFTVELRKKPKYSVFS